jgi:hypothetical protein
MRLFSVLAEPKGGDRELQRARPGQRELVCAREMAAQGAGDPSRLGEEDRNIRP